jgi:rhodanese-related sulfurtransferase
VPEEPITIIDISPEDAQVLVEGGAFLLDVREDDEWMAGHAPDAVHLPMGQVADRLHIIPKDRVVVCLCRVGGRSGAVAASLAGEGFDVRNVDGGMLGWEALGAPVVTDAGGTGRVI